jgi:hypothetical protein
MLPVSNLCKRIPRISLFRKQRSKLLPLKFIQVLPMSSSSHLYMLPVTNLCERIPTVSLLRSIPRVSLFRKQRSKLLPLKFIQLLPTSSSSHLYMLLASNFCKRIPTVSLFRKQCFKLLLLNVTQCVAI